jgi:hypothetical protein
MVVGLDPGSIAQLNSMVMVRSLTLHLKSFSYYHGFGVVSISKYDSMIKVLTARTAVPIF